MTNGNNKDTVHVIGPDHELKKETEYRKIIREIEEKHLRKKEDNADWVI